MTPRTAPDAGGRSGSEVSLRRGASWAVVSSNVKELMRTWEEQGAIAGSRPATRKDAIRRAVSLSLREASRSGRRSRT